MNEFDSFLIGIKEKGYAALDSLIKYLGFEHHNISYYNDTLAETSVDDLRMTFAISKSHNEGYFTVYDDHYKILDRAVFKHQLNIDCPSYDWKEIEDD